MEPVPATISIRLLLFLALAGAAGVAAAEEFRYYVWEDAQGIVHADETAPRGVDYQVRVIENINANVIPAEDFRLYENPAAPADGQPGLGDESATPDN